MQASGAGRVPSARRRRAAAIGRGEGRARVAAASAERIRAARAGKTASSAASAAAARAHCHSEFSSAQPRACVTVMACLLLEYEDIRSYPRGGVRVSPARGTECVAFGYPAHAGGVAVDHHVGRVLRRAEYVRPECREAATPRLATAGAARGP